jgi:hypothetical protein
VSFHDGYGNAMGVYGNVTGCIWKCYECGIEIWGVPLLYDGGRVSLE